MQRVVMVGWGAMAQRHANWLNNSSRVQLVGIVDPHPTMPIPENLPWAENLGSLNIPFDWVIIAAPNGLHLTLGREAIAAKAHMIIEKPIGLHFAAANSFLQLAAEQSLQVLTVTQNRCAAAIQFWQQLHREKALGTIQTVSLQLHWKRDAAYFSGATWHGKKSTDGGILFTQFAHFLDWLAWSFNNITVINSCMETRWPMPGKELPDAMQATFLLDKDIQGSLDATIAANQAFSQIKIVGEKGYLIINGQYMDELMGEIEGQPVHLPTKGNAANDLNGNAWHTALWQWVETGMGTRPAVLSNGLKAVQWAEKLVAAAQ